VTTTRRNKVRLFGFEICDAQNLALAKARALRAG
jgi:hypothetical protein